MCCVRIVKHKIERMRMEIKTMRRGTPASKTLRVVKARTREGGLSRASGGRRIALPHASIANNMSSLSCPICAPQTSADDADFLYYPSDEEIPVSLCKVRHTPPLHVMTLATLG